MADLAYDAIRALIVSGSVAMGDRLKEIQLSKSLGISRAPIREALQRLAAEGLVEESAHQGVRVTSLTAEDIVDIYNVRVGLETTAIRLFMARKASLAPLRTALRRMQEAAAANDMMRLVRAELEFHRTLTKLSGNRLLSKLYGEIEGRVLVALVLDDAQFDDPADVAAEHVPILEALESRVEDVAVEALQAHIVSTIGPLIERLGSDKRALLGVR